jgi:hypothetical protein
MARSTTEKRRLIKFSNYSMCITLPKWVIDQLEWKKGDVITLVTDVKDGKITLSRDTTDLPTPSTAKDNAPSEEAPAETIESTDDTVTPPKLRW